MHGDIFIGNSKTIIFLLNGVSWKLLMLMNCSDSLSGRGIFKDDEEPGRKCVELPIQYFQKLFKANVVEARDEKAVNEVVVST